MIGCCFQDDKLFEDLTVYQHIKLFVMLKSHKNHDHSIKKLISQVQLQQHIDINASKLSGGLRRRLSIALAISCLPSNSILVLDEPTSGLDALVRDDIWKLIKKLSTDRCVILST
jgi:ABC-type multidrug transport system ATPase subunit